MDDHTHPARDDSAALLGAGSAGKRKMASTDPFYVVKDEPQAKLAYIQVKADRFNECLASTASSPTEFRELRKALGRDVRAADSQCKDLKVTLDYRLQGSKYRLTSRFPGATVRKTRPSSVRAHRR